MLRYRIYDVSLNALIVLLATPTAGITTVLTMAFLGIDTRRDLPKVSYSTALDYFVGICFAFVLATIIQFAGVHFFTKHGSGEIFNDSDTDDDEYKLPTVSILCIKSLRPGQKADTLQTFSNLCIVFKL